VRQRRLHSLFVQTTHPVDVDLYTHTQIYIYIYTYIHEYRLEDLRLLR
jgi:hypothetical protein